MGAYQLLANLRLAENLFDHHPMCVRHDRRGIVGGELFVFLVEPAFL